MNLVSVIIAAYNCETYIQKAVDSIVKQTHTELEILICDDCSTDSTWNILQEYTDLRIKIFRNKTNKGVVATRNFLLTQVNGDYIIIQDADDWSSEDRVETLLHVFHRNEDISACGSAFFRVDSEKNNNLVIHSNSFYIKLEDCHDLPFMPASLMMHRSVYDCIGGYNSFFSGLFAEDLYWIIVILGKFNIYYLNVPLYYYRFNPYSITNSAFSPAQFLVKDIIEQIINQRKEEGNDWISENKMSLIEDFKMKRFKDKRWLSEKYRIAAAVQRDGNKRGVAAKLILKALLNNPLNFKNYITLRYVLFF